MIKQDLQDVLTCGSDCVNIIVIQTSDKRLAKQLADHHLSLAQAYRQMAGMEPIQTGNHMRKVVRECNR